MSKATLDKPFVLDFLEKVDEHEVLKPVYSEVTQRGLWDKPDVLDPVFMSPTTLHTSHGDTQGDESH